MAGYSTTPLAKKLGIKENALVVVLGAPPDFAKTLAPLPEGARVTTAVPKKGELDVALVFSTTRKDLELRLAVAKKHMAQAAGIWIAWPKKASGVTTEINEALARKIGLAAGLVDNKVCAVDEVWSGLRFVIRVADRKK
ncbi:MAG: DUF3052 domain-containing protein [Polyangiaceae bacterium]